MKTSSRFLAAVAVSAGFLASCADIEEINNRLDEFDGRITALETVTTTLNKNVEALQTLYGGATINSATEKDGIWVLVLSNGETLTLTQGSIGVGNAPVMSVDKDGYWMVNYGSGAEYILKDGNKVSAIGTDGKTPVFGVDADGYWTVKYDADATAEQILGADGKPVKALPEGGVQDPYFADVKVENGEFKVTLRTGEQLVIPVISNFLCAIECEGVQEFNAGETKPFNVNIKGVKSTMITTPAGWSAVLSEPVAEKAVLTVTAPVATKAVIADSKSDICILAFSSQGLATIAKMSVSCSDTPVMANPVASVTAGEATETTLAYSIAVSDVTSWKYIHLKESEAAPDAAKILSEGTEGTETALTFEGLEPETAYVLYVLPVNGETQGAVASGKNTTLEAVVPAVTDLYQAYLDGQEIEIAGVKYSKAANGDPVLLEATAADTDIKSSINQKSGVFFLDAADGANFTTASVAEIKGGELILIGRHTDKETILKPAKFFKMVTGGIVLNNITIDMNLLDNAEGNDGYFLNNSGTEDLTKIHFDGCKVKNIQKQVYMASSAGCAYAVKSIKIVNCDFELIVAANTQLFNLYKSSVLGKFEEIVFDNNIVCNKLTSAVCQIFNWGNGTAQTETTYSTKVSFCNNTLYNAPSGNCHFKYEQVASLKMSKNLLWASAENTNASYMLALYGPDQDASVIDVSDNIAYGLADGKSWTLCHSNSTVKPETNTISKLDTDPLETVDFTTYTFTPAAAYASYGAQR